MPCLPFILRHGPHTRADATTHRNTNIHGNHGMTKPFRDLTRRFVLFTIGSWALAPILGYSIALHYGMVEAKSFFQPALGWLIVLYLVIFSWVGLHFFRFLTPVQQWIHQLPHPHGEQLPDELERHIQSFSGNYWLFHLLWGATLRNSSC